MGTVPSLTSPLLAKPLVDSREILEYLDQSKDSPETNLLPSEPNQKLIVGKLIEQAHSDKISTNILLFLARNEEELEKNRKSGRQTFLHNRQEALEEYHVQVPEHSFYAPKMRENGSIDHMYETPAAKELVDFFQSSQDAYQGFIRGFQELDSMLVLPYAAGDSLTAADIHIAPWLSHAMMAVGTDDINDLRPLEMHLQKSSPEFKIGKKTREWWSNMNQRPSFKEFYPKPH
jgi:glutathione S-transferase